MCVFVITEDVYTSGRVKVKVFMDHMFNNTAQMISPGVLCYGKV